MSPMIRYTMTPWPLDALAGSTTPITSLGLPPVAGAKLLANSQLLVTTWVIEQVAHRGQLDEYESRTPWC